MGKKVLIIQRRMVEYRLSLFERLRRRLTVDDISLDVIYGAPTRLEKMRFDEGILPWGIRTSCSHIDVCGMNFVLMKIPAALTAEKDLVIIPHENSMLINYWLLRGDGKESKVAFWGHGANFQSERTDSYSERLKGWTARRADWWFAYTPMAVRKIVEHGFPEDRITCLYNTIDTDAMTMWLNDILSIERETLLSQLGLYGNNVGVFIGALSKAKRIEFFLSAADKLRESMPDFEVVIIGDGPLRQKVEDFASSRKWCRWVGARHGREKALYLSLGHVILNPGFVGLNIIDSFTAGIPLVTTDCRIHSPEIHYLESGRNALMTADDETAFVREVEALLTDTERLRKMSAACKEDTALYSLDNMVENFVCGIKRAMEFKGASKLAERVFPKPISKRYSDERLRDGQHIVMIWQRFLPYHKARIIRLQSRLAQAGHRLTAIEVAAQDAAYGFPDDAFDLPSDYRCCFPGTSYHDHPSREIYKKVLSVLDVIRPDIVFAPATAFPEGMAAFYYRLRHWKRAVMMDDMWEQADRKGLIVKTVKRLINSNIDGAFIPAASHLGYYRKMGFSEDRIVFGVDVVDNDFFSSGVAIARANESDIMRRFDMPSHYFLYVGRFLPRKGLKTLIDAFGRYCGKTDNPWNLVLIGSGDYREEMQNMAAGLDGVRFLEPKFGEVLCYYYGLAKALVVPSIIDPWGLVINEGMASGLPVIVSKGCGATRTLIKEGENGWTFDPGDSRRLTELMEQASSLPPEALEAMGKTSQDIIKDWSLERFADGVISALQIPRRAPAGLMSNIATKLWKGRVAVR